MHVIKSCVDATHGLHPNMRSHTRQMVSLGSKGRGVVYSGSSKHIIHTKSSMETELVGASDALPQVLWAQSFIELQGYNIKYNNFNQDNHTTMLLDNNGRGSRSKLTRQINILYFFITDRIKKG